MVVAAFTTAPSCTARRWKARPYGWRLCCASAVITPYPTSAGTLSAVVGGVCLLTRTVAVGRLDEEHT